MLWPASTWVARALAVGSLLACQGGVGAALVVDAPVDVEAEDADPLPVEEVRIPSFEL